MTHLSRGLRVTVQGTGNEVPINAEQFNAVQSKSAVKVCVVVRAPCVWKTSRSACALQNTGLSLPTVLSQLPHPDA